MIIDESWTAVIDLRIWANAQAQANDSTQGLLGKTTVRVAPKGTPAKDLAGRTLTEKEEGVWVDYSGNPGVVYRPPIPPLETILAGKVTEAMVGQNLIDIVKSLIMTAVETQPEVAAILAQRS